MFDKTQSVALDWFEQGLEKYLEFVMSMLFFWEIVKKNGTMTTLCREN